MRVSDHSLRQLDEGYLGTLSRGALEDLSGRLVADLKDARDRLGAGPQNSSRPPSSRPAWEKGVGPGGQTALAVGITQALDPGATAEPAPANPSVAQPTAESPGQSTESSSSAPSSEPSPSAALGGRKAEVPRRPGKQPGAAGVGRTQVLTAHHTEPHRPEVCGGCGQVLAAGLPEQMVNGYQEVDLLFGDPAVLGMVLRVTAHRWFEVHCPCGHHTRSTVASWVAEPGVSDLELSAWRLVGPGLATLIVALAMRFRMSRARIAEFLDAWMGLRLSIGTIHQTLHEAAAVVAPAEAELVAAVLASDVLHADETPWPEQGRILWLWVFCSTTVVLYYIAHRGRELLNNLLPDFAGWLMSDGWTAYRVWPRRLRCWPHLIRKAKGLNDSCERTAQAFGAEVLGVFERLIRGIHAARDGPLQPPASIAETHADDLRILREACVRQQSSPHAKTRALAVELLNDWVAIFQVLSYPTLPISNNDAERILRHWVILRQLCHGTRTEQGSRYFALLASVIDTCRLRQHSPWLYLRDAITQRRSGKALPALPAVPA